MGLDDGVAKKKPSARTKTRPSTAIGKAPRKRASGLSRDRIVNDTLAYLRAHPDAAFSLNRAAAIVGATPMAIYRHFRDVADLADALLEKIFEGADINANPDADWHVQARTWMQEVYTRLVETRQSVVMLASAGGNSMAWTRTARGLRNALTHGGLREPHLTESVIWVTLMLSGFTRQNLATPLEDQLSGSIALLNRLEEERKSDLSIIKGELPRIFGNIADIVFDRILASVDMLIQETAAPRAGD